MSTVNHIMFQRVYRWIKNRQLQQCTLCGAHQPHAVCQACQALLPYQPPHVCRCGLSCTTTPSHNDDPPTAPLCGRCLTRPPPFDAVYAHFEYRAPINLVINRYKHQAELHMERAFALPLADSQLPWTDVDAFCPLPSHFLRRWQRGFDQSERLARYLSVRHGRPTLAALTRQRVTPPQQGLSRAQRARNLQHAFRCTLGVKNKTLVLVDDVMTTGASAQAATRCLLAAGAAKVYVWVLARTPET